MSLWQRTLLATDLSARSDRALDRAMMLAGREDAELVVLHVLEPLVDGRYYPRTQPLGALAALARAQLLHDLGDCAGKAQIHLAEGDPAEVIVATARELRSTLVVVGVARIERLGRFVLGKTVERLVRTLAAPLLIVTDRPRRPYERVAVTVDLSPVSTEMVRLAAAQFPGQPITAFHAYQPVTYGSSDRELAAAQWKQIAETDVADWLAAADLPADVRRRLRVRLERGEPAGLLREAAAKGAYDLVVLGTRGRGRVSEFFVGSVAKRILAELPCDALFVRESGQGAQP